MKWRASAFFASRISSSNMSSGAAQPEEELVEDESGALDADVGAVFTVTVNKGSKSLV